MGGWEGGRGYWGGPLSLRCAPDRWLEVPQCRVLEEGQKEKVEGCRLGGDFRQNQKGGLVEAGAGEWRLRLGCGREGAKPRVEGPARRGVISSEERMVWGFP